MSRYSQAVVGSLLLSITCVAGVYGCIQWSMFTAYRAGTLHLSYSSTSITNEIAPFVIAMCIAVVPLVVFLWHVLGSIYSANGHTNWNASALLLIGSVTAAVVIFVIREPTYRPFLKGLAAWASANVDAAKIRELRESEVMVGSIDPRTLPEPLSEWEPSDVRILPDDWVVIVWGGGFAHWGLFVGPDGSETPRFLERDEIAVAPGLVVWHERY